MVGLQVVTSGGRDDVTIRLGADAVVTGVARWDDGSPVAAEAIMTLMNLA